MFKYVSNVIYFEKKINFWIEVMRKLSWEVNLRKLYLFVFEKVFIEKLLDYFVSLLKKILKR